MNTEIFPQNNFYENSYSASGLNPAITRLFLLLTISRHYQSFEPSHCLQTAFFTDIFIQEKIIHSRLELKLWPDKNTIYMKQHVDE